MIISYLLSFFFFNYYLFIYFIFGCVGSSLLRGRFSSCSKRGPPPIAVRGLLIMVASLVEERGLLARGLTSCDSWAPERRLSSCGTRAQLLGGMWDLPGPGLEPVSPALAGGFPTTAPPGKPLMWFLFPSGQ